MRSPERGVRINSIGQSRIEEHLRHLRCLARTRRRNQNEAVAIAQSADNVGMDLPDGKGSLHRKDDDELRPKIGC